MRLRDLLLLAGVALVLCGCAHTPWRFPGVHTAASGAAPGGTDSADAGAADQQGGTATGSSPAAAA
ncbi:MAG TPA: hypothetical protein VKA14_02955, partial [Gammaproteobacteria bacterium]|nr:hypothetical protein [Gammaproteobacteria bacterium]